MSYSVGTCTVLMEIPLQLVYYRFCFPAAFLMALCWLSDWSTFSNFWFAHLHADEGAVHCCLIFWILSLVVDLMDISGSSIGDICCSTKVTIYPKTVAGSILVI